MKKLLSTLVVFGIALAAMAQEPRYALQSLSLPQFDSRKCVVGSTPTNFNGVFIDCRKQKDVAIQLEFNLAGNGTEIVNAVFAPSMDGITNDNTRVYNVATAGVNVVPQRFTTNIAVDGIPYLKLLYITNANTANSWATNISIKYGIKIGAN